MPLSRLDNFLKNVRGNILYVNPNDLDATDDIANQGNSMGRPFVTIQRALIEAARFSYQAGIDNDRFGQTTILLSPGTHYVDNRPGWIPTGASQFRLRSGATSTDLTQFSTTSEFRLSESDNELYKLNSIYGGVVVPRGTSIVGQDIKKTKIRPMYVPDPENSDIERSAIFRLTGGCYIENLSILDASPYGLAYKNYTDFQYTPNFSHHKLAAFEYEDGVNETRIDDEFQTYFTTRTDLDMYYEKVGIAYGPLSGRGISPDYPDGDVDIQPKVDEYRIIGPISGEVGVSSVRSGDGVTATTTITVTLDEGISGLDADSDFEISGIDDSDFNGSYKVSQVLTQNASGQTLSFTYSIPEVPEETLPTVTSATVTLDADTITGSSPFLENVSLSTVYGMCGVLADGSKVTGHKEFSMIQFIAVGLQKDNNAFVKFNETTGAFDDSSSVDNIHSDPNAKYKPAYYNFQAKATNNASIKVISCNGTGYSHQFVAESGGEVQSTNSNSNYGQTSLSSSGFKNVAFQKDDVGYITDVIPPKEIESDEVNLEYDAIDVVQTVGVANTHRLYLYQRTNLGSPPRASVQGFRLGAKENDRINVNITIGGVPTNYYARIVMPDTHTEAKQISSVKVSSVGRNVSTGNSIASNTITFTEDHDFLNGETIRMVSDNGRLPDGLNSNQIYFAIVNGLNDDQLQFASTPNDAANSTPIDINNLGGNLTVESRVSDKIAGNTGHPIQFDSTVNQWYLNVGTAATDNSLYPTLVDLGSETLGDATARTFITRSRDNRTLEDRIYKMRYVIPSGSGITSARPPRQSFVIEESNTVTGDNDTEVALQFNPGSVTMSNENEMRNFSFIRHADWDNGVAQYTTETPHGLSVGAKVLVENVISTNNTTGAAGSAFNGTFTVSGITSANAFQVNGTSYDSGDFTNNVSNRTTSLPTYKRVEGGRNIFIYNVEEVSQYVSGEQDGIYYLTVVNSDSIPQVSPFNDNTSFSFSQPIQNLYPQLDRDNPVSDPAGAISYSLPQPLGEVVVDEVKNSITKRTIELSFKEISAGIAITDIVSNPTGTSHTIFTQHDHGLKAVASVSVASSGAGYGNGTGGTEYLYDATLTNSGTGVNATAVVSVNASGQLTDVKVMYGGCNYAVGDTLNVTGTATTTGFVQGTVTVDAINDNIGDVVRLVGVSSNSYQEYNELYRITGITTTQEIEVSSRLPVNGVSVVGVGSTVTSQSTAIFTGQGLDVSSFVYDSTVGLATVTTSQAHGLVVNNKVFLGGADDNFFNKGFIVNENVGLSTFVLRVGVTTLSPVTTGDIVVYRPGISAQDGGSTLYDEKYGGRFLNSYAGITTTLSAQVATSTTDEIEVLNIGNLNLQIGDYVRIDDEIMRIKTSVTGNPVKVFRGLLGTQSVTHIEGSVLRKIVISPTEFRKPSSIRASSHTFEYVGYGPGNYSTALPDRQDAQPSTDEQLLSQSFRSNCGINVYNGMNDRGDFYVGNKKFSSLTGKEEVFDTPIPTVTGEDIFTSAREIGVEIINPLEGTFTNSVKVEGGTDGNIISEFNGPVVFSQKITSTSDEGIEANELFLQGDTTVSRKYTVGLTKPTSAGNPGDVVFNANPEEAGIIGWTYTVNNGWYGFGPVSEDQDSEIYFADKLGLSTGSLLYNGSNGIFQVGSGSSLVQIDEEGNMGIGGTANGAKLRVEGGNIVGSFIGDGSGLINVPNDSLWTKTSSETVIYPYENENVSIGSSLVTGYKLTVGVDADTTGNDLLVQGASRFDGTADFNGTINIDGGLVASDFSLTDTTDGRVDAKDIITTNLNAGITSSVLSVTSGVGIGTLAPRADLDVEGSLRMKSYYEVAKTLVMDSGVVTLDLSQSQTFLITLTQDITRFTLLNVPTDGTLNLTIRLTQDATGGRTVDIDDIRDSGGSSIPVYWPGGVVPTMTSTSGRTDIYSFMTFDGGATLYGVVNGQNFT